MQPIYEYIRYIIEMAATPDPTPLLFTCRAIHIVNAVTIIFITICQPSVTTYNHGNYDY
ncbi:hypothetical protein BCR41DRAFT_356017 [Lobosporangium transversale]|uniref:Uncharacterized protein n=1 Tax=Lobosporangium transversale TaxID=64571 RepID=A0A1Y2GJS8_9FUNG|nr:hypothetical protein BCR41DRAFT_356017 [Lobosporangium transversale]ORZ12992.1 hypothetical protein BCR41DRAFT_356017 [Lobosporangium transversale]|eukprot:XP_021880341.1 hypothetical protein BCR41DRAFT_356017 [Lobosporangium transversale]